MENEKLQLFEDQRIRTAWDEEREEWHFAIVDVVGALSESKDSASYWRKLKQRLKEEGNETVTNCHALRLIAADGKRRMTDVATTEISKQTKPEGLDANKAVAKAGGSAAKAAKESIEESIGKPMITSKTAKELNHMITSLIEASADMSGEE